MNITKLLQTFNEATEGFQRLILITISVVILVGTALFALRQIGLNKPPLKSPSDMLQGAPLVFARGNLEAGPFYSFSGFASLPGLGPSVVPAVDLRSTVDRQWLVLGPEGEKVELITAAEAKERFHKNSQALLFLSEFLEIHPWRELLLIVHSRDQGAIKSLVDAVSAKNVRIFAYSPNHLINRELRQRQPQWRYGSDAAQLAQWHVFAALGLEPWAAQDFDWLVDTGVAKTAPRVKDELERREIPSVWNAEGPPPANSRLLGVMTSRPRETLERLKQSY